MYPFDDVILLSNYFCAPARCARGVLNVERVRGISSSRCTNVLFIVIIIIVVICFFFRPR